MAGISYGGGSSTDQIDRDIGGYPHSGQGDPSGITAKNMQLALVAQNAKKGLGGIASKFKSSTRAPDALDHYSSRNVDDVANVEPGRGFGGIKNLFQ